MLKHEGKFKHNRGFGGAFTILDWSVRGCRKGEVGGMGLELGSGQCFCDTFDLQRRK